MRRPVDIDQLLSSNAAEKNTKCQNKPIFLSKKARSEVAAKRKGDDDREEDIEDIQWLKTRKIEENKDASQGLQNLSKVSSKTQGNPRRGKFQFDWSAEDDTMSDYRPVIARKPPKLQEDHQKNAEDIYMGQHWSQKSLEDMTDRDWRILREDFHIETKGGSIQHPLRDWSETGLIAPGLVEIISSKLKYREPTPIQRITIPNVLRGRDFVGIAATGSGKTLAFLLPSLCQLSKLPPLNDITKLDGPFTLILAPTRELAQQIEAEAKKVVNLWSRPTKVTSIVGGHSIEEISYSLSDGCDILVATPGRLIDCLENRMLVLKQVRILVLDEADRMIDFGFEDQLTTILARTESVSGRQTMMFTATMSNTVEKIANGYLTKPAYVRVGSDDTKAQIKQIVEYLPSEEQRFQKMARDILPKFRAPIMIFINYKKTADWLVSKFSSETRFKVTTLHGSKSQEQREHSLNMLRTGKVDIMIATDVAGRGIDIPDVSLVVNFQMCTAFESYVHRIGRTGRAGRSGCALTFLGDKDDIHVVEALLKYVRTNDAEGQNVIHPSVKQKFSLGRNQTSAIIN